MTDDKVVPIRPEENVDVPEGSFRRLHHKYNGPTDAIKQALLEHGFDDAAVDQGWIELRIVARFTDVGAMFHTLAMARVELMAQKAAAVPEPTPEASTDRPSFTVLHHLAEMLGLGRGHFIVNATVAQMSQLDEALADLSDPELRTFVYGTEEEIEALQEASPLLESAHEVLMNLIGKGANS